MQKMLYGKQHDEPFNGMINNKRETEKVYQTSVDSLGHITRTRKHQDWFDENDDEILLLLDERCRAHEAVLSQQTRN